MSDLSPIEEVVSAEVSAEVQTHAGTEKFRQQMGQISRQSSVFFAGTVFTAAAAYLFKVYLARFLGAEALGIYALGMTLVGLASAFNALGLPQSALRFVAAYSATGKTDLLGGFLIRSTLLLSASNLLFGGAMVFGGRWIAIHLYHTPALSQYIYLFALIMAFGTMNVFLGQVLAGYKDVAKRTLITNFIGTPAMMALTIPLVFWGLGLWGYLSAQVVSAVLITVLLAAVARKLTPQRARSPLLWSVPLEKQVVWFSAASLGMVFLQYLAAQTDKILIGVYLNARDVGIYAVAMGLVAFVPSVLQAVNQIFAPTIAELYACGDHALLSRIFQTLSKWVLGLTLPLIIMILIFAHPLMRIFGHDFEIGASSLIAGTLGELVDCGVGSVGFLLLMSGNERRLLRIQSVMVAGIVVLNLLLIPRWGIAGAAIGSAVANAITNFWCLSEVNRILGLFPYTRSHLRLLAPVTGSFAVLWLTRSMLGRVSHPAVVIGAGLAAAYAVFVGVALLFGLDSDDQLIARAIWGRLRGALPRVS